MRVRIETFKELFGTEFQSLRDAIAKANWPEVKESIESIERSAVNACEELDAHWQRAEDAEAKLTKHEQTAPSKSRKSQIVARFASA